MLVDPDRPELADEVLDWAPPGETVVLETEKHLIKALERHGYQRKDGPFYHYMDRELNHLPAPVLPEGFTARPVGPDDVERRVAWHPATAVCLAAMHAARQAGAQQAIVYPVDGRPAVDLYAKLGFRPYARTYTYAKTG